ncbi:hypothetical protein M3G50_07515 [Brachybacterium muris]|uniref:hypothetical protein n=1 Tax=Brachybacterium muris TaxID=219301 RepID=UPI0021A4D69E|nr:hypothetical protein [Brachybacterium muris]MCT1430600.1 hypothetical protein [Brachybacterium muris]
MTLTDRARIAEQIITDFGDPSLIAVTLDDWEIDIHTREPVEGIDYRVTDTPTGTHYRHEYMDGEERVALSCWIPAEEAVA